MKKDYKSWKYGVPRKKRERRESVVDQKVAVGLFRTGKSLLNKGLLEII